MKYIMVIVAAMVILASLGAIGLSIRDARTVAVTDTYQLTTTNSSSASVQLSDTLWENATSRITLSSNSTADVPLISSYTANTRNLAVTGFAENSTRSFTVEYYTAGLSDFSWVDDGIKFLPTILILGIILVIAAAVMAAWQSARNFG